MATIAIPVMIISIIFVVSGISFRGVGAGIPGKPRFGANEA